MSCWDIVEWSNHYKKSNIERGISIMRKSVLIKNTTRKEREDIVKEAKQISKILDINEKAVANRTHRLRLKIKRLIEPILEENEIGGS